ncbi:hypothetical protein GGH18_002279 [Coemansia sp. RSA 530]|nr:hypothetical protein GGH18_002279 [Coemansia sp. RSA 530]KAJ2257597.1 hypothetical protein GGH98_000736 [Coemansia sp. RSA 454]KAJ2438696.1 hypothetical protein IWW46_004772 [Coemansia sp. RSA 2440]KAJ2716415.1 hypothetical protein H4S00_004548 [Coemansia sp. D1744]
MFAATRTVRVFTAGSNARAFHQSNVAAEGIFGRLFGRKKKESPAEPQPIDTEVAKAADTEVKAPLTTETPLIEQDVSGESLSPYMDRTFVEREPIVPKFPQRNYSPKRLEGRLRRVLSEAHVKVNAKDWKSTSLAEKETKLKVLSGVIMHMKLRVPSRMLNNVHTVGDLLQELSEKPQSKDAGHPVAAFYAEKASELPSNMKFEPFVKGSRSIHARN